MVQAELHQEPKKNRRPPLQPVQRTINHCKNNFVPQLTENREYQQLEVPEDNQAVNENIKKVT